MTKKKVKPAKQDENEPDEPGSEPQKVKRMTMSGGILHEVDRSFYDAQQDCVIDILRIKRSVQNKKGEWIDVEFFRHQYCKDESIQAKYRNKAQAPVEVEVVVDG